MGEASSMTAFAGGAATIAGGAASAYSSYTAGQDNKNILRYNATLARLQAGQAIGAGEQEAGRNLQQLRAEQAKTNVAFASQGVVAGAGTAGAVLSSEEAVSEMDRLMIRTNARRQAFGFQTVAANDDFQANNAASRGTSQAIGTLLDTGAKVALEKRKQKEDGF